VLVNKKLIDEKIEKYLLDLSSEIRTNKSRAIQKVLGMFESYFLGFYCCFSHVNGISLPQSINNMLALYTPKDKEDGRWITEYFNLITGKPTHYFTDERIRNEQASRNS
jgi:hypothetical protein